MRHAILGAGLLTWMLATSSTAAPPHDWDGFHPTCGAPGDLVYVQGRDLNLDTVVRFAGMPAEVIRAHGGSLTCRVPRLPAAAEAQVQVDGAAHRDGFRILAPAAPVVHALSAHIATPDQTLLLYGRRLAGAEIELIGDDGAVRARIAVVGGRRAASVRIPTTLPAGTYGIRARRDDAPAANGPSLDLDIRLPCARQFYTVEGGVVSPAQRITLVGENLGPLGSCEIRWHDEAGRVWDGAGWCNGFDRITSITPSALESGRWHTVEVAWPDGDVAELGRVRVRAPAALAACRLDISTASSGDVVGLCGLPATGPGPAPEVWIRSARGDVAARTLCHHGGGLGHGRAWLIGLPTDLEKGTHPIAIRQHGTWIDAGVLRVE